MNGQRRVPGRVQLDELRALGVVDLDGAVEAPRKAGGDDAQSLELAAVRPSRQARREEQRLALGRDAGSLELRRGGRECFLPRVVERAGERQCGRLDHDRRPPATGDERLERVAREREAQRIAHRGAHVGNGLAGRGRPQHDGVVGRVDDGQARPDEQRDPLHYAVER